MKDAVDKIGAQWATVRPDLDTSPIEVIGRVSRLSRLIDKQLRENFQLHGLDQNWMYDVLATLRRRGEPFELTAGDLVRETMVTTGAVTNRIDRLEEQGLIERVANPADRRQVLVHLTAAGLKLTDEVADAHYSFEEQLISVLDPSQRAAVAEALRSVLIDLGDTDRPQPAASSPHP